MGHVIESCPRDPNIVTLKDKEEIEKDAQRLDRINNLEGKKKFVETQITTTQMMKTLVKVPYIKQYDKKGQPIKDS